MMSKTMNTMTMIYPIAIDSPATPPSPSRPATTAMIKKMIAHHKNEPSAISMALLPTDCGDIILIQTKSGIAFVFTQCRRYEGISRIAPGIRAMAFTIISSSLLVQDRRNGLERGLGVPVSHLRLNMRGVHQFYKPASFF
ncbi:MAG: hypothetical protein ACXV5N_05275 [Halobacteriota archaeon]